MLRHQLISKCVEREKVGDSDDFPARDTSIGGFFAIESSVPIPLEIFIGQTRPIRDRLHHGPLDGDTDTVR